MKTELRKISTYTVCKDECHFNEDIIKTLPNIKKKKKKKRKEEQNFSKSKFTDAT